MCPTASGMCSVDKGPGCRRNATPSLPTRAYRLSNSHTFAIKRRLRLVMPPAILTLSSRSLRKNLDGNPAVTIVLQEHESDLGFLVGKCNDGGPNHVFDHWRYGLAR
jgi:hypothetical protein